MPEWITSACPCCGSVTARQPYDIGSGPELSCASCEWCWGADGQDLRPLDIAAIERTNAALKAHREGKAVTLSHETGEWTIEGEDDAPKDYPHQSGDFTVLGPGVFASPDEAVINWKGVNYERVEPAALSENEPPGPHIGLCRAFLVPAREYCDLRFGHDGPHHYPSDDAGAAPEGDDDEPRRPGEPRWPQVAVQPFLMPAQLRQAIAELRGPHGLTADEIAQVVGVSRRTVTNWSNGEPATAEHRRKLAELLQDIRLHDAPGAMSAYLASEATAALDDQVGTHRADTPHDHRERVPGCFRCELGEDEVDENDLPPLERVLRNRARCDECGDIIESTSTYDNQTCSCGGLTVDGGLDYRRRGFRAGTRWTELAETDPPCQGNDDA